MSKSHATWALVVAMILGAFAVAVPPSAMPPSVTIRIGGADLIAPDHYAFVEGTIVSMAVTAQPDTVIALFATALDEAGESDPSTAVLLLAGNAPAGQISGDLKVPLGLAGRSFQLQAVAMNGAGQFSWSTTIIVDVERAESEGAR